MWGDSSADQSEDGDLTNVSRFWVGENSASAHFQLGDIGSYGPPKNASNLTSGFNSATTASQRTGCWDAWAEAHHTFFSDAGSRKGQFLVGYVGIDCKVHPSLMLGFLGQVDWMNEKIGSISSKTDGIGWMVGPYATARLTPDLFFDFRAAWGRSDNDVDVGGVKGDFGTSRWLIDGQLTGNVEYGDVRITPEVSLAYIEDRHKTYIDSSNNVVPSQTVSLGRLRFGPEISRRYVLDTDVIVEPHMSLRGIWDFVGTDVTLAGVDYNIEGLRGALELGVVVQRPDDYNLRVTAKYDGIGAGNYHAFGGQIWLNIPLN